MRHFFIHCNARVFPHTARNLYLHCRSASAPPMNAAASSADSTAFHILAPLGQSTRKLAALLARDARVGDCICLHGDVGAGKSVFRWGLSHIHGLCSNCLCMLASSALFHQHGQPTCAAIITSYVSAAGPTSELWRRMRSCRYPRPHTFCRTPMTRLKVHHVARPTCAALTLCTAAWPPAAHCHSPSGSLVNHMISKFSYFRPCNGGTCTTLSQHGQDRGPLHERAESYEHGQGP